MCAILNIVCFICRHFVVDQLRKNIHNGKFGEWPYIFLFLYTSNDFTNLILSQLQTAVSILTISKSWKKNELIMYYPRGFGHSIGFDTVRITNNLHIQIMWLNLIRCVLGVQKLQVFCTSGLGTTHMKTYFVRVQQPQLLYGGIIRTWHVLCGSFLSLALNQSVDHNRSQTDWTEDMFKLVFHHLKCIITYFISYALFWAE